jgi:hypothetical protein
MIGTQQVLLDDCSFFHRTLAQGFYIVVTMFQNLHHKLQNMNYLMTSCRSYHQLWQRKRCVEPGVRHGNILLVYRPPIPNLLHINKHCQNRIFFNTTTQPETPQTCCKLWIFPACCKLSTSRWRHQLAASLLKSGTWIFDKWRCLYILN